MATSVAIELNRLKAILSDNDFPFRVAEGATDAELTYVETTVGITLTSDIRELYETSNGVGPSGGAWFAVKTDELTPCTFLSLQSALDWWAEWLPYDETVHAQFGYDDGPRDERIQPGVFLHRHWLPIAEFNCFGTTVFYDAAPTDQGVDGQIIAYQHDPDHIYYLADSVAEFLRTSKRSTRG